MDSSNSKELKAINKQFTTIAIIDMPASVMVGLGLYGKFAAHGQAFHPLLNDPGVVNILLIAGAAIMFACAIKLVSLTLQRKKLQR